MPNLVHLSVYCEQTELPKGLILFHSIFMDINLTQGHNKII